MAEETKTEETNDTKPTVGSAESKIFTQEDVNGIIARRVAQKDAEIASAKAEADRLKAEQAKTAEEIAAARAAGVQEGVINARREAVAKQYGLDVSVIPDKPELIDKFETGLTAYSTSHMRVVPEIKNQQPKLPDFIAGVR